MPLDDTAPDGGDRSDVETIAAPTGPSDADCLRLAQESYQGSTGYFNTSVRTRLVNDLRQFQSRHPMGSRYGSDAYKFRSSYFVPKTRAAVRKHEAVAAAALFATNDALSIKAWDEDDPIQLASAEVMKQLVAYRLKRLRWFQVSMGAYQDAMVQGIVCSKQYWEFDARRKIDRPRIDIVPIENVRFDPNANWLDPVNTSPYFIELMPMFVKDVRARMKGGIDGQAGKWKLMDNAALLKASRVNDEIVSQQREGGAVSPRNAATAVSDYTIVWVHRNIVEIDGQDFIYHTLATVDLLDRPRPLKEAYFHGRRPYVIGVAALEAHKVYATSPVRLGGESQRELNEQRNLRMDAAKYALNKRLLVRRNSQADLRSLQRNAPGGITLVGDVTTDVAELGKSDVPQSAFAEQDRLNLDYDELMGNFSQSSVQSNRKLNETVGGMDMLTRDASQVGGYQLTTWVETWAEPVLDQLVLLEQYYEDDAVVLALAGKKAQLMQRFGMNEITDELLMQNLTIEVNIGLNAVNPHDRVRNLLEAIVKIKEALADGILVGLGLNVGEFIREIMGALGYKDGKRFFPDDQDPAVRSLLAEVDKLRQALSSKHPPEVIKAQVQKLLAEASKIKREGTKVGVETVYTAVQTGEVLAAVPQVAPVADEVMVIGGHQPPVPAGVDPNLPDAGGAMGAIAVNSVQNKRTGMEFTPGAPTGNTNPSLPPPPPKPPSPGAGAAQGIETQRFDGVER